MTNNADSTRTEAKLTSSAVEEAAPTYFPTLDGLRFVPFFHFSIHHYKVSGAPSKLTGRISVPRFFIRRSLRIWPLYFFFVVGIYAVCVAKYGLH